MNVKGSFHRDTHFAFWSVRVSWLLPIRTLPTYDKNANDYFSKPLTGRPQQHGNDSFSVALDERVVRRHCRPSPEPHGRTLTITFGHTSEGSRRPSPNAFVFFYFQFCFVQCNNNQHSAHESTKATTHRETETTRATSHLLKIPSSSHNGPSARESAREESR